ncbi:hypothetical protein HYU90_01140 [Candidatus Collierbacteria bacterium]|nr:hypothetical protein [Candidatus Collierbacteria bacterium]
MSGRDCGNEERGEGKRSLPELPGERLAETERPIFVPKTNEGPTTYRPCERTEVLVIYHGSHALAKYDISGHDDPDDPINIDGLVEDVRDVIGRSGLSYEVGEYFLKNEECRLLDPVEVFDSHNLGVGFISEYQDGGDDSPDE